MSGGSYNYLCYSDEPWYRTEELEGMAEALDQRGYTDAAAETRQWLHYNYTPPSPRDALKNLWRAVEWKESGDWAETDVVEEYAQYQISSADTELDTTVQVSRQALLAAIRKARALYIEAFGSEPVPDGECWAEFERLAEYLV